MFKTIVFIDLVYLFEFRGDFKSPPLVIPNEVRNLKGIDIKRFLPLVEMTIDTFLSFEIISLGH
jgi:hypothetical protein